MSTLFFEFLCLCFFPFYIPWPPENSLAVFTFRWSCLLICLVQSIVCSAHFPIHTALLDRLFVGFFNPGFGSFKFLYSLSIVQHRGCVLCVIFISYLSALSLESTGLGMLHPFVSKNYVHLLIRFTSHPAFSRRLLSSSRPQLSSFSIFFYDDILNLFLLIFY